MAVFLVAYDLNRENNSEGYETLKEELLELSGHRVQRSLWLVKWGSGAGALRDHLKSFIDDNDFLFVTRLRPSEFARQKAMHGTKEWLEANPP